MTVSRRNREHMATLGALQGEGAAARHAEHLALDLDERLAQSFALARRFWSEARRDARTDDPSPFYERARALGLYRP
jgi:hypothetical protein